MASGVSPISSRKIVPRLAAANRPRWCSRASVNAPRRWPNSWLSSSVSGIAEALTATKGPWSRGLCSCSVRASSSLPVPLSVVRRQLERFRAAHPGDRGRASRHARRRRPAPSALRAVAQRARRASPTCCSSTWCGRRSSRRPGGLRALDRFRPPVDELLRVGRGRPIAGTARSTPCRGSWTSACSIGAPISCRRRRATSTSWSAAAARRAHPARAAVRPGLAGRALRRAWSPCSSSTWAPSAGAILDDRGRVRGRLRPRSCTRSTFMRDAIHSDGHRAARRAHVAGRTDALRVPERPGGVHAQLAVRASRCCRTTRTRPSPADSPWRRCRPAQAAAPTAALGGSALAVNACSDQPDDAYRLIDVPAASRRR